MKKTYVLENQNSEVARFFDVVTDEAQLICRHDTRRVEMVEDTSELEEAGIGFDVLAEIKGKAKDERIKVGPQAYLRLAKESDIAESNIDVEEDEEPVFKKTYQFTAGFAGFVLLVLLIGALFTHEKPEIVAEVVVVPKQEEPVKEKHKQVVQAPHEKKTQHVVKHVVQPHTKTAKVKQIASAHKAVTRPSKKNPALTEQGALAVLGSMKASDQVGGLEVKSSQTTRGVGLGGNAGSGGMQTAFYGKGLTSVPLGPGARAEGAGGYGSHGAGGGRAGYGKMSLVGSQGGYFLPLQAEAEIEGGLDQSEIDEVIQRHQGQIRYCYEQGLQSAPKLSGRVTVHFMIGGAGGVNEADVANSSLKSGTVEGCILGKLRSWKFPQPRNGVLVKVNYPFVLKRMSNT